MKNEARHPLVRAYLGDLDRALTGSDAREHAETMAEITEHLDQSVPPESDAVHVRRVLAELGPVESIAAVAQPAPQQKPGVDPLALATVTAAGAAVVLLFLMPFVAVPLAVIALVLGVVQLRTRRTSRTLAIVGVVLAAVPVVMVILLAVFLVQVRTVPA